MLPESGAAVEFTIDVETVGEQEPAGRIVKRQMLHDRFFRYAEGEHRSTDIRWAAGNGIVVVVKSRRARMAPAPS